jgi:competence protein ComEC
MGNSPICECWFLDVGQGSANVILIGEGRAIVIDSGPATSVQTMELLRSYVDTIEVLIITHNDKDHDGNVARILYAFPKAVRRIFFLRDRSAPEIRLHRALAILSSEERKNYPAPERLEADPGKPKVLFKENELKLSLLYPTYSNSLNSESAGARSQNYTSGILKLSFGDRRVVFSGDATIEAFDHIASKVKHKKPLLCDVMTVPHHGGKIASKKDAEQASQDRLYSEIITPRYAVVSVGTINTFGHPTQELILSLIKAGVTVLCTQMTPRCSADLEAIRSLRRTISRPARSTRSECRSAGGYSKHVACFGSVVAEVFSQEVRISKLVTFEQDKVSFGQVTGFAPICKPLN